MYTDKESIKIVGDAARHTKIKPPNNHYPSMYGFSSFLEYGEVPFIGRACEKNMILEKKNVPWNHKKHENFDFRPNHVFPQKTNYNFIISFWPRLFGYKIVFFLQIC